MAKYTRQTAAWRDLVHVLLAFALLLGQQAMLAHAATHLAKAPTTQDKQLPGHQVCEQCVWSAQFGNALLNKPLAFEAQRGVACGLTRPPQVLNSSTPRAFRSRAPPLSV